MSRALDALNAWVAHPLAWAQPLERPTPRERHLAIRALVEVVVIDALSHLLQQPDALPFAVENALRAAAGTPLPDGAWLAWLEALEQHAPDTLPTPGLAAEARSLLETPLDDATWPRLLALAERCAGPDTAAWCWVHEVDGESVIVRPLKGTGHPSLETRPARGVHEAGQLVLWRGTSPPTPVPRWLARWDTRARTLRVFAGRAPTSGRPRYRGWQPDDLSERNVLPADAPAFLADLGWSTPAPVARQLPPDLGPEGSNVRATHHMAAERIAAPPRPRTPRPVEAPVEGSVLALQILGGRHALHYAVLEAGQPIVVGRSAQHATLVLPQHQISRAHTRVRLDEAGRILVSDLGSTNGTQRNGEPVFGEVVCEPGDVIAIGPIQARIGHLAPDVRTRIDHVLTLARGEGRDPLTGLLESHELAAHVPEALRAGFREGGPAPADAPPLWGLLAYVDRLAALHAQHGEQVADGVFSVTSRLTLTAARTPDTITRVGYGEILVPWVGDEAGARAEAARLVEAVAAHPWGPPVRDLSLTVAVVRKAPETPANTWLATLRQTLQEGRRQGGRGRVY